MKYSILATFLLLCILNSCNSNKSQPDKSDLDTSFGIKPNSGPNSDSISSEKKDDSIKAIDLRITMERRVLQIYLIQLKNPKLTEDERKSLQNKINQARLNLKKLDEEKKKLQHETDSLQVKSN